MWACFILLMEIYLPDDCDGWVQGRDILNGVLSMAKEDWFALRYVIWCLFGDFSNGDMTIRIWLESHHRTLILSERHTMQSMLITSREGRGSIL